MIKLIINSDDFGLNSNVNTAILTSFEKGLISSASLLSNFPFFTEAINMIHQNNQLKISVGVHINLTEGIALTNDIMKFPRFCTEQGMLTYKRHTKLSWLSNGEMSAIYKEIKEQTSKVLEEGIQPTHIDSHHHIHTEYWLLPIFLRVAKEFGITKIRVLRNIGANISLPKMIYKKIINYYLSTQMETVNYFGSIEDFQHSENKIFKNKSVVELMVHSKMDQNGNLIDLDHKKLEHKILPLLSKYKLLSYRQYLHPS